MKLACCWGSLLPPQPTIRLILRSSQGQRSLNFLVDTAFSGYLSLQKKAIEELGLEYLGKGSLAQYFEVEIPFYLCEAWVVTPDNKPVFQLIRKPSDNHLELREGTIDLEGRSRKFLPIIEYILPLAGLGLLSQGNWLLLGEEGIFCLFSPEVSQLNHD